MLLLLLLLFLLLLYLYYILGTYISTTGQCFRILLIPHPSQELGGKSMITRSSAVCGYHQEERDMYSYLCNRALAATCHATASNKTNKVKFVWVGLIYEPISPIIFLIYFAFFDVFQGGSRKTDSNLWKKGAHIRMSSAVLPFFRGSYFPRAMVSDRIQQWLRHFCPVVVCMHQLFVW